MVGWHGEGDTRVCLHALTSELKTQLQLLTHPPDCVYSQFALTVFSLDSIGLDHN